MTAYSGLAPSARRFPLQTPESLSQPHGFARWFQVLVEHPAIKTRIEQALTERTFNRDHLTPQTATGELWHVLMP
jgi:hypothetical protein